MLNFLFLEFNFVVFLTIAILLYNIHPRDIRQMLSQRREYWGIIGLTWISYVIFILQKQPSFIIAYFYFVFTIAILSGFIWISSVFTRSISILFILMGYAVVFLRLFFPSELTHNLFIGMSVVWLGVWFRRKKIITPPIFVGGSIIWFFYDIVYVWITPAARHLAAFTEHISFPLGLFWRGNVIGSADLLWAVILFSVLRTGKYRFVAAICLLLGNLMLDLLTTRGIQMAIFPLLVLWVPMGITLVYVETRSLPHITQ